MPASAASPDAKSRAPGGSGTGAKLRGVPFSESVKPRVGSAGPVEVINTWVSLTSKYWTLLFEAGLSATQLVIDDPAGPSTWKVPSNVAIGAPVTLISVALH